MCAVLKGVLRDEFQRCVGVLRRRSAVHVIAVVGRG